MKEIIFEHSIDGVLTNVTYVKLKDPTDTYGVKRNDTDAIIVAKNTALALLSTGRYYVQFAEPAPDLHYTAYLEWQYDTDIFTQERQLVGSSDVSALSYCTLDFANAYFANRLYSNTWTNATDDNKQKALNMGFELINQLNICIDDIVPNAIKYAECLIAIQLLKENPEGFDPRVISRGFGSVRTSYNPDMIPDHILAGIPSALAWAYLRLYLKDPKSIRVSRVS